MRGIKAARKPDAIPPLIEAPAVGIGTGAVPVLG